MKNAKTLFVLLMILGFGIQAGCPSKNSNPTLPGALPTNTMTPSASSTPSGTPTTTPTLTPQDTASKTPTSTPSSTASSTPTDTPTDSATPTASGTPTSSSTASPTSTFTSTGTDSPTSTPTDTDTPTGTPTPTATSTCTSTSSNTPTVTDTPTHTGTPTHTLTNTPTSTPTSTATLVCPFFQTVYTTGSPFVGVAETDSGGSSVTFMAVMSTGYFYLFYGPDNVLAPFSGSSAPILGNPSAVVWNKFNSNFYVLVDRGGSYEYVQQFTASGGNPVGGGGGPVTWGNSYLSVLSTGITSDASGNIYITVDNPPSGSYIAEYTATGSPVTTWGLGAFHSPLGIAYDSMHNQVLVANSNGGGGDQVMRFNLDGTNETAYSATGLIGGIALDSSGNVYVGDNYGAGNEIAKFDGSGNLLATFAPYGSATGDVKYPQGIAVDSQGYIFIADGINYAVYEFAPY